MRAIGSPKIFFSMFALVIFLFSSVPFNSEAHGNAHDRAKTPPSIEELRVDISSLLTEYSIPGAGIAIVAKDSIVFIEGLGYANMAHKVPVTADTRFRMGSITKSFVALGFLKLVEEGRIDLQISVKDIVPEINIINPWEDTDPVRLVHLLEHTSGFGNSFKEFNLDDDPEMPLQAALTVVGEALTCRFRPGTCYSYSNTGYGLAGYILEKVTGIRYEDFLKTAILNPVGMESSTFILEDHKHKQSLAQGYVNDFKKAPYVNVYSRPAGIMLSTAGDMARYVQFMLNRGKVDGKQIVSEASIIRMETPTSSVAARKGLDFGYGLGTEQSYRGGYKWLGHNGAHFGFYCDFWYNCDLNIGYVALLNRFDMAATVHVIRDVLTDYLVRDTDALFAPAVSVPTEQLESYAGHYARKNSSGELLGWVDLILGDATVSITHDTVCFQHYMEGTQRLIPVENGLFREPDMPDASIIFFTTQEGKKALVNWNSYYEETAAWKPWVIRWSFIAAWIAMLSTIPYALVWIPVAFIKRMAKKPHRSKYLRMRIVPLLTIVLLLYGFALLAAQDPTYLAKTTPANVQFTILTWLFAGFSFISLFLAIKSFWKPVRCIARIYALVVSSSCVGMTLFLGYWGMIGLRLWTFN